MGAYYRNRAGIAWLGLLLVLAFIALLFQVFPSLWFTLLWAIDVRNWSRSAWFSANVAFVLALVCIRYGPDLLQSIRERRARLKTEREKENKQRELREKHEIFERIRESRKRRLY